MPAPGVLRAGEKGLYPRSGEPIRNEKRVTPDDMPRKKKARKVNFVVRNVLFTKKIVVDGHFYTGLRHDSAISFGQRDRQKPGPAQ